MGVPRHSPIVAALAETPMLAELKRRARKNWAAGDYGEIARLELCPWASGPSPGWRFAPART